MSERMSSMERVKMGPSGLTGTSAGSLGFGGGGRAIRSLFLGGQFKEMNIKGNLKLPQALVQRIHDFVVGIAEIFRQRCLNELHEILDAQLQNRLCKDRETIPQNVLPPSLLCIFIMFRDMAIKMQSPW
jgi:hypothetical protein